MAREEWYSNRELFEMVQTLKGQMAELSAEIENTTMLLREYNGLRARLDKCELQIHEMAGAGRGGKEMWGYLVGGLGVLLALISYAVR